MALSDNGIAFLIKIGFNNVATRQRLYGGQNQAGGYNLDFYPLSLY